MKTRPRSVLLLAGAGALLLVMTLSWLRMPAGAAPAGPAALTPEQNAAIQVVDQLLLYGVYENTVYLPLVAR